MKLALLLLKDETAGELITEWLCSGKILFHESFQVSGEKKPRSPEYKNLRFLASCAKTAVVLCSRAASSQIGGWRATQEAKDCGDRVGSLVTATKLPSTTDM